MERIYDNNYAQKIIHNECPLVKGRKVSLDTCCYCCFSADTPELRGVFGSELERTKGVEMKPGRSVLDKVVYDTYQVRCLFEFA